MRRLVCALLLIVAAAPALHAEVRGAFLGAFVAELEPSVSWYRDKLGLEVVERPDPAVAILEGNGLIVELIQHKDAKARAQGYVQGVFKAGAIVDDFDALVARFRAKKADIAYGPFPARGKQRANVIVRDNEGNLIQFFAAK